MKLAGGAMFGIAGATEAIGVGGAVSPRPAGGPGRGKKLSFTFTIFNGFSCASFYAVAKLQLHRIGKNRMAEQSDPFSSTHADLG